MTSTRLSPLQIETVRVGMLVSGSEQFSLGHLYLIRSGEVQDRSTRSGCHFRLETRLDSLFGFAPSMR